MALGRLNYLLKCAGNNRRFIQMNVVTAVLGYDKLAIARERGEFHLLFISRLLQKYDQRPVTKRILLLLACCIYSGEFF